MAPPTCDGLLGLARASDFTDTIYANTMSTNSKGHLNQSLVDVQEVEANHHDKSARGEY